SFRISNALVSYVAYLVKFFWPVNLSVFYPYPNDFPTWQVAGAAIILVAITVIAFRRRGFLAVGWFWYLVTLVPVIGIIQIGLQARADRYTYIPTIGFSIALAWLACELLPGRVAAMAGIAACVACFALTWSDLHYWRDSASLFQHAIESTSGNY